MFRFLDVEPRLPTSDLDRALSFYSDVLGFRAALVWPREEPTFAILERDGSRIQFFVRAGSRGDPGVPGSGDGELAMVWFDVRDLESLHAGLSGRTEVEWGPELYWYGRREFGIRDPDGRLLIFSEAADTPARGDE